MAFARKNRYTFHVANKWKQFKSWITSDRVLLVLTVLLVLLNFADAGLSWFLVIHLGLAVEANPFMAFLMGQGTIWFFLYKFGVMPILAFFLYRVRSHTLVKFAIIFGFVAFLLVMIYSGIGLTWLISAGFI